jgi:phage shock protein E
MKTISAQEYHKIKDQIRTIDVRTEQEYKILVRFNWAENIPIDELVHNVEIHCPDKGETIVTVCNAGNRSSEAARLMNNYTYYVVIWIIFSIKTLYLDEHILRND